MNPSPRTSGFSIVELLVVMAITLLLIGLLAPALSGVQGTALSARCRTNLRAMAVAAIEYAHEYQYFPPAVRAERIDGVHAIVSWDYTTSFDGRVIHGPGSLWARGGTIDQVHQCPAYSGPADAGRPATGYNYNTTYLGAEGSIVVPGWATVRMGERYSRVTRSARCAVFGCGGRCADQGEVANRYMRAPEATAEDLNTVYAGAQAFRHDRSTNVAWVDGHVSATDAPHRGVLATDALSAQSLCYPRNGFLSDDDSAYRPR